MHLCQCCGVHRAADLAKRAAQFCCLLKVTRTRDAASGCAVCNSVTRMAKTSGCALSGFVLVKKVPGAYESAADCAGA